MPWRSSSLRLPKRPSGSERLRARGTPLLALLLLVSCGKEGPPLSPLSRGPHPPKLVAARQLGRRALVAFEVPRPIGPKPSQQPTRAELLRVSYSPGLQPPTDPDAFRRRGEVVGQVAADPLPSVRLVIEDLQLADLPQGGTGWTLRYGIRVLDRRGRPSPVLVSPDLVLLPGAPAPTELSAEPTVDGVRLVWQPIPGETTIGYNVYRSTPEAPWPGSPVNPEPIAATEFLDSQVTTGQRYIYTVRVALATTAPYREGEPSEMQQVLAEDLFAPAPPQGLVAVQEGLAVRLFWDPNSERDLAGYRLHRSVDGGPWIPVGPGLLDRPSYLDEEVEVGSRLTYRVVALDRAETPNFGEPSQTGELQVEQEPLAPARGVGP